MFPLAKKHIYFTHLLSGLLMGFCVLHSHFITASFVALFALVPMFYTYPKLTGFWPRYWAGLLFASAYFLPNSLWFFYFMPIWQAILALTFPVLFANIFTLPILLKNSGFLKIAFTLALAWLAFVAFRVQTPGVDFWWFPHLGYTQWKNTLVVQLARWGGIYPVIGWVLLSNILIAYALHKKKFVLVGLAIIALPVLYSTANQLLNFDNNHQPKFNLIALQATHDNTQKLLIEEDYNKLERMTENALQQITRTDLPTFVVWPEAEIHTDTLLHNKLFNRVQDFVRKNNIYLSCVLYFPSGSDRPNEASTIIDPNGKIISKSFKKHTASEEYSIGKEFFEKTSLNGVVIGAADCFDFHFPDIKEKMKQTELFFGNIDDGEFGKWLPYFHAVDILFHAVQTGNSVLTSSFNGPTFYARKNGSVVEILPLEKDGVIITTYNLTP